MEVSTGNSIYQNLFLAGIMRSVKYDLGRIQQVRITLPPDLRRQTVHTLDFALKVEGAWPATSELLVSAAPHMEQAGYREDWMGYLQQGIQQSQKLEDRQKEAELRLFLGEMHQYQAQYDDARREFERSIAYFQEVGQAHDHARALNSLANVARLERHFDEATQLVEKALTLAKEAKEEQAHSYFVLGAMAFDQRAWQNAHSFFERSLVLWQASDNPRMMAWGLSNVGLALWRLNKYEEAIACYKRAIKQFERIQDPVHQAVASMNLGIVYFQLQRLSDALDLYLEAEPTFRDTQERVRVAMVNNNKGMAYQKLEQWHNAEHAYRFSMDQWQKIGNISALVNVMDNLGLLYSEQGLVDQAITTFSDALNSLAQIKDDPNHDHLFKMLSTSLAQTQAQKAP
ncbi:MAG: tetratricopeptide repeat protein [Ardenticatenaceae bacterium]